MNLPYQNIVSREIDPFFLSRTEGTLLLSSNFEISLKLDYFFFPELNKPVSVILRVSLDYDLIGNLQEETERKK